MRTQRLELRLTDEERPTDEAAAAAVGESLSDFFRRQARNPSEAGQDLGAELEGAVAAKRRGWPR